MNFLRSRAFLLACFLLFAANAALVKVADVDVGYHIRTGEWIWQHGRLPSENTFSFTHEHHSWLLQQGPPTLLIYALDRLGGPTAIVLGTVAMALAIFAFVLAAGRRRGAHPAWLIAFAAIGLMAARFRFNMRPDLLSALLFSVLGWHLAGIGAGGRVNLRLVVILLTVWVNSHAGYVYGAILLTLACAGELADWLAVRIGLRPGAARDAAPLRQLLLGLAEGIGLGVMTVWMINPSGPKVLLLPFRFFTDPYCMTTFAECARATPREHPWFFALLLASLVLAVLQWKKINWAEFVPLLAFSWLAFSVVRNILFFAVLAVPLAAAWATAVTARLRQRPLDPCTTALPLSLALLAAMAALTGGPIRKDAVYPHGIGLHPVLYPETLFRILRTEPVQGELFNDMRFGGPLMWRVGTQRKVFIDGRLEAYEEDFWKDVYDPVCRGEPLWTNVFDRYDVNAALVSYRPGSSAMDIAHRLSADTNWVLVGWAERALLFARRIPAHDDLIRRRAISAIRPLAGDFNYITPDIAGRILEESAALEADGQGFPALWTVKGRASLVRGDWEAAGRAYEKAAAAGHPSPLVRRDLAFWYVQTQRIRDAERLAADLPPDATTWSLKGEIAEAKGNPNEAQEAYARAVAIEPANAGYRTSLGLLLAQQKQWKESIGHLQAAVAAAPQDPACRYNLALACFQAGDLDAAASNVQSVVAAYPSNAAYRALWSAVSNRWRQTESTATSAE